MTKPTKLFAVLSLACLIVTACGPDTSTEPSSGTDTGADMGTVDRHTSIPSSLDELVDVDALFDPSMITYEIDEVRSGRVPGDFGEPVWQIGVSFESQTFLGEPWTHSAVLVIPDTLPSGVRQAAILPRSTDNPVSGVSDSENFLPEFAAITADRLDIPVLLVDNIPPSIDLRGVSDLQSFEGQYPECFQAPLNDDRSVTDCLWSIAQEAGRLDWFPALPTAVAYVRSVTLMQRLSDDVASFDLGFEVPPFRVEEVVALGSGLGGLGLRYAMAMDASLHGVMVSSADIGAFGDFFQLQLDMWTAEFSFGDATEQVAFWTGLASGSFRDAFSLASLRHTWGDRSYLMAIGSNDERFPLSSLSLYEDDLPTDRANLYIADYGSGFGSLDHLLAWRVFIAHVLFDRDWAQVDLSAEDDGGNLTVTAVVNTTTIVTSAQLWYTQRHSDADDGDFRDAVWQQVPMEMGAAAYTATVAPLGDNIAYFVRINDVQDIFEGPICSAVEVIQR